MIGKSIEFSLVVDSKRRCKGMYFATVVSEKLYWDSEYYTYEGPVSSDLIITIKSLY